MSKFSVDEVGTELSPRIYLDQAATSWPKPPAVLQAMLEFYQELGSAAGRGSNRRSQMAVDLIEQTRRKLAALLQARSASEIIFCNNGTDALNKAIFGVVVPGDHLITTTIEHNSVLRPLRFLEEHHNCSVTRLPVSDRGLIDPQQIASAINAQTRLIIVSHASNVLGTIQPLAEIGRLARERSIPFLVDAAQTIGTVAIDVQQIGCPLLAAPGHKGLFGPLGTGVLYIDEQFSDQVRPLILGGTGTHSESDRQPESLPGKYESGNLNTAAIAGLGAAIDYLNSDEGQNRLQETRHFKAMLINELKAIEGITVYGPCDMVSQSDLVSFNVDGVDARELAGMLESSGGIETRAGFHCAPLIHQQLETESLGGCVRASWSRFNTEHDLTELLGGLRGIAAANIF